MSTQYWILDSNGEAQPVPLLTWAAWFKTADRRVRLSGIGGYTISTVFLGTDHQFGDGPPLLFETMVFDGKEEQANSFPVWRYTTRSEALAGHQRMIELVEVAQ